MRAFSILCLLAALLFWWQDRHATPPPAMPLPPAGLPPVVEQAPARPPSLPLRAGVTVTVDVLDPSGSALAGVAITLNGVAGVSDAQGRVVLQGVQQGVLLLAHAVTGSAGQQLLAGSLRNRR